MNTNVCKNEEKDTNSKNPKRTLPWTIKRSENFYLFPVKCKNKKTYGVSNHFFCLENVINTRTPKFIGIRVINIFLF